MARITATIVCRHRWWLKYFVASVLAMSKLTRRDPDMCRVMCWIERGIVVEVH